MGYFDFEITGLGVLGPQVEREAHMESVPQALLTKIASEKDNGPMRSVGQIKPLLLRSRYHNPVTCDSLQLSMEHKIRELDRVWW